MDPAALYRRLAEIDVPLRLFRLDEEFLANLRENYLLFSFLNDRELETVFRKCMRKMYRPGETIFQQGELGTELFLVVTGTVKIVHQGRSGPANLVGTLENGDLFGEMALLAGTARPASALAETECVLFALDEKTISELDPAVALKFYKYLALELSQKLTAANNKLDELFQQKAASTSPGEATPPRSRHPRARRTPPSRREAES